MRKIVLGLMAVVFSLGLFAQKAEVLYFKANLGCCQARACDALEHNIKNVIEENFSADEVSFKVVRLGVAENNELVQAHSARSQTVVIVSKEKDASVNVSAEARMFSRSRDKDAFHESLVAKLKEL